MTMEERATIEVINSISNHADYFTRYYGSNGTYDENVFKEITNYARENLFEYADQYGKNFCASVTGALLEFGYMVNAIFDDNDRLSSLIVNGFEFKR